MKRPQVRRRRRPGSRCASAPRSGDARAGRREDPGPPRAPLLRPGRVPPTKPAPRALRGRLCPGLSTARAGREPPQVPPSLLRGGRRLHGGASGRTRLRIPSCTAVRRRAPAGAAETREAVGPAPPAAHGPSAASPQRPRDDDRMRLPHTAGATEGRGAALGTQQAPGTGSGSPPPARPELRAHAGPREAAQAPLQTTRARTTLEAASPQLEVRALPDGGRSSGRAGQRRAEPASGLPRRVGHAGRPGPRSAAGKPRPREQRAQPGAAARGATLGAAHLARPGAHSARLRVRTGRTVPPHPTPATHAPPARSRRAAAAYLESAENTALLKFNSLPPQRTTRTLSSATIFAQAQGLRLAGPPRTASTEAGHRGASLRPQSPSVGPSRLPSP